MIDKKEVGRSRWQAFIIQGKVEYFEWVLRTVRGGRAHYIHKHSFTWGKLSKRHGDYGWLNAGITVWDRTSVCVSADRPYAATKRGALKELISDLRDDIRRYGADTDLHEDGSTLQQDLDKALRAQRRMKA